jgi:hypothetical protein
MPEDDEETPADPKTTLITYQCERCGFVYNKVFDYPPLLCYRCMRFLAKRLYTIMHTIQPAVSRPERDEV